MRSLIGSPLALLTFEAAARHLSFTRAAEEMGVSQAAVSQSVRQLEDRLGVSLFQRRHRGLSLTEAGERFHADVSLGLGHIRRSAEDLRRLSAPDHVTLSISTAFANFWMLPRLAALRVDLPEVDLRLQTTDKDVDLVAEGIALGIRRGPGNWPGCEAALLAEEEILAVASPAYLAAVGAPRAPQELTSHRLIHLEEPFRPRPGWVDWFAACGVAWQDRGDGLRLNDYALVLQAALEGQGVAIGWRHLIERLLATGLLVRATDATVRTEKDFYLVWPARTRHDRPAMQVRDWLLREARSGAGL